MTVEEYAQVLLTIKKAYPRFDRMTDFEKQQICRRYNIKWLPPVKHIGFRTQTFYGPNYNSVNMKVDRWKNIMIKEYPYFRVNHQSYNPTPFGVTVTIQYYA